MNNEIVTERKPQIRLHYKEVVALINLIEETIKDEASEKLDFSNLSHSELSAYSRLQEMRKQQEAYAASLTGNKKDQ